MNELYFHNPGDYSREYFEPLNKNDCQTYLSPLLYEADQIWFKHSYNYGLKSVGYISQELEYVNLSEIIKYSELVEINLELNEDGNITFKQLIELCHDDNKKRILCKIFINAIKDNEVALLSKGSEIDLENKSYLSPWTIPSYDLTNLINQYCILNLMDNGKNSNKNTKNKINVMEVFLGKM